MTVDMLAAAFIWPEEMLIGRTHIGDDMEAGSSDDALREAESASTSDATPFWAALIRRFRVDPSAPGADAR